MKCRNKISALLGFGFIALACVNAHPITSSGAVDAKLGAEIDQFRARFQAAGAAKDAAVLKGLYTDDFTHTHTSGKVDNKDARIVSVISGEQTVEMAAVREFRLSCYGDAVCVVRALSPIKRAVDLKWFDVRWTQTYIRSTSGWQIAVSQATGLPATVRDNP